ncbi:MAG: UvrD-helicase domain-containing protein [Candidatus Poribacteria bacterium]|nr:UvrD-helicase domain-containing protein [Candidatus Poribacteria bacterium]
MPRDTDLNEKQRQAVEHGDGPLLVLAGPGTGKTRVVACRVAHLIESGRCPADALLAITFTNKAAHELEERVLSLLGSSVAGESWIGTFHHTCARILRESGGDMGIDSDFGILDQDAQDALMAEALRSANLEVDLVMLSRLRFALSARKSGTADNAEPPLFEEEDEDTTDEAFIAAFKDAINHYGARLADYNALDFDDLIAIAVEKLRESPTVLERYQSKFQHILIDEYQDINGSQYELISLLSGPKRCVTAVGDANQSVYRWRGSDPEWMRRFRSEFQPETIALEAHYRSTRTILSAATGLIRKSSPQTRLRTDNPPGNPVRAYFTRSEAESAYIVKRLIQKLHAEARMPYRDIAVFYRNHRTAERLEDSLRRASVPFRRAQPARELVNDDANRVLAWLRYICFGLGAHLADALMFPNLVLDEWTRVWFQWRAMQEGKSFRELAENPADAPPLTRASLKRVVGRMQGLREKLTQLGASKAAAVFFDELETLRNPFRHEELENAPEWADFPQLAASADVIAAALQRGEIPCLMDDGSLDAVCAQLILQKTFEDYFDKKLEKASDDSVEIRIGNVEPAQEAERAVWINPPDGTQTNALQLTAPEDSPACAAWIAYRLCQRLLDLAEETPNADVVVYDLETTGANPRQAEIIEFAGKRIYEKPASDLHLYIRPRARISRRSTQIHGIDADTVRNQPRIEERISEIRDFFGSAVLVGHNIVEFDNRFIEREMRRHLRETPNNPSYDTLKIARRLYPHVNHTLTSLAERFQIEYVESHRAVHDAAATAELFKRLRREEARRRAQSSLSELLPFLAVGAASKGAWEDPALEAHRHAAARWLKANKPREETLMAFPEETRVEAGRSLDAARRSPAPETDDDRRWQLLKGRVLRRAQRYEAMRPGASLKDFVNAQSLLEPLDNMDDADEPSDAVSLMTLHTAKGTEFRAVLIVGLEDGTLPWFRSIQRPEALDEERRLLYVGMTRAQERLYLIAARRRGGRDMKPSRFLREIPSNLMRRWSPKG